jgi:hypothetical protein
MPRAAIRVDDGDIIDHHEGNIMKVNVFRASGIAAVAAVAAGIGLAPVASATPDPVCDRVGTTCAGTGDYSANFSEPVSQPDPYGFLFWQQP